MVTSSTNKQERTGSVNGRHNNNNGGRYEPLPTTDNKGSDPDPTGCMTSLAMHSKIIVAIVGYSACSSSLLLLNKMAIYHLPSVSFVLLCQFISSIVVVKICALCGWLDLQPIQWLIVKKFWGVSLLFACCLFTNVKALQYANVETLIVFRALSPIAVTVADYAFLDMELPTLRSWIALISIVAGAIAYVYFDGQFRLQSYAWVCAYFVSIVSEMVFVKYIITEVKMGTWDRVYLNNMLSIIPVIIFGFMFDDPQAILQHEWTEMSVVFLALSSIVGIGISYTGFHLRAMVTATSFTVVGVVNKIATTALNFIVWDQHAELNGIISLMFCIIGGAFYQQASPRKQPAVVVVVAAEVISDGKPAVVDTTPTAPVAKGVVVDVETDDAANKV